VTIADCEFEKSVKAPMFEDQVNEDLNIIAADGDLLSDG
jgi:hypothetical protein